jgi:type I restriction enzyme, S subunit
MSTKDLPTLAQWPKGWRNVPLWALFDRIKDVGHPHEEMLSVFRSHGVIKKSSLHNNNQTAENRDIYQLTDKGWFIVNRMKAWRGSVGISPLRGIVSGHYICFRPKHDEDPRFLNWLLRSDVYAVEYARMSRGVRPGQIEIDNDELRGLRIALPPLNEQHRIADFLDAETARADTLIEKNQRMIMLLEDRIHAFINQICPGTIVCGSDGRPVGIAGLKCVRLGSVAAVQGGFTMDEKRERSADSVTLPYLRVANVHDGSLALEGVKEVTLPRALAERSTLRPGDVLMTEGGDPDKLGRGAVWTGQLNPCLHQNAIFAVRPDSRLLPEYLALVTRTRYARAYFEMTASKTTGVAHTSSTKITAFRVPLRPVPEQDRLVRHVHEALARTNPLRESAKRQLELLAERRQALITAAVTGEIDITTAGGLALTGGVA